jgi:sulfite exporter TauE/SafE
MPHADLYALFLLGILGTGHCVGMCGPLVFAFPARSGRMSAHLFYHLGRIGTYTAVGGTMGAVGLGLSQLAGRSGLDPLAWIARLQVGFSLLAAGFLLVFGLARLEIIREPAWMSLAAPDKIPGFGRILRSAGGGRSAGGMLVLGMALGFLPCGLSFAAFARALPAGGLLPGALMTLAFGLGTLPGLLLLGTGASGLARRYRRHSDILSGMVMIAMAASLGADVFQAWLN